MRWREKYANIPWLPVTSVFSSLDTILILLFFLLHFITVQSKVQYDDKLWFEFPSLFDSWINHPIKTLWHRAIIYFCLQFIRCWSFFYYAKIDWVENQLSLSPVFHMSFFSKDAAEKINDISGRKITQDSHLYVFRLMVEW